MEFLNLQQLNNVQSPVTEQHTSAASPQSGVTNVPIGKGNAVEELCRILGIDRKTLEKIEAQYPGFTTLGDINRQIQISTHFTNAVAESTVSIDEVTEENPTVDSETTVESENTSSQKAIKEYLENVATEFDHKAFADADTNKKLALYAEAIAQNKYLFSQANGDSEVWKSLPNEEKQQLIEQALNELKANNSVLNNDTICRGMLKLQTANFMGISYDEYCSNYTKRGLREKLNNGEITQEECDKQLLMAKEYEHDYLFTYYDNLDSLEDNSKLSDDMIRRISSNIINSEALISYIKISKDYDGSLDNISAILSPKEIDDVIAEYNKNRTAEQQIDINTVKSSYLENYCKNLEGKDYNELTVEQKILFVEYKTDLAIKKLGSEDDIQNVINLRRENENFVEETILNDFRDSKDYKQFSKDNANKVAKNRTLSTYLENKLNVCKTEEEKQQLIGQFYEELLNGSLFENAEEVVNFMNSFIKKAKIKIQNAIINNKNIRIQKHVADNTNCYNAEQLLKLQEIQEEIAKENPSVASYLRETTMTNAEDEQLRVIDYSGCGDIETESAYFARGCTIQNPELQQEITDRTWTNSSQEAQAYATKNIGNLNAENQNHAVGMATQSSRYRKENTAVFVDEDVLETLTSENQTAAHDIIRNAIDSNYNGNEAINLHNNLTDQIANCDENNQQTMYEHAMQSSNEAVAKYAQKAYETRYVSSANNTTTQNQTQSATSTSSYQTNPISSQTQETTSQVTNVSANNTSTFIQVPEKAIAQLNLQEEADQQKLVEIVAKDSSVLGKLDQQLKKAVLEVYCKRLDGAQIFQLFKKNPSLYSDLLRYSGEKLNLYKDDMFKIIIRDSISDMTKLAKEFGIDLTKFAKQNKEFATRIAIATKNTEFANEILRNPAFYGLQMGSSEYYNLQTLVNKRNKSLTKNEKPIYLNNEDNYIPPRHMFKA